MPEFARSRDACIPAIPDPTTITAPIFLLLSNCLHLGFSSNFFYNSIRYQDTKETLPHLRHSRRCRRNYHDLTFLSSLIMFLWKLQQVNAFPFAIRIVRPSMSGRRRCEPGLSTYRSQDTKERFF